jgi:large subunit ribosomal protein L24
MKIHVKDNVKVMKGKDRGKTGEVTQVFPKESRLIVQGINKLVKHLKARGGQKGQRIEFFAPISLANVQILSKEGKVGRVGFKFLETPLGKRKKIRVHRAAGRVEEIV